MLETMRQDQQQLATARGAATAAPPLAPHAPGTVPAARIDKSQLAIAEPRRLRDKVHLKFVATQPCLVCGRRPCDPHHLRFAQPRAIGMKVSDEFTVPLCRGHHRELHRYGDEKKWWEKQRLEPMGVALKLWRQSHLLPTSSERSVPDGSATTVQDESSRSIERTVTSSRQDE